MPLAFTQEDFLVFFFQGFAGLETTFGKRLIGMLATDVGNLTGVLPKLERLKGTLRLMFNTNAR